jgi:hypothetical protein
VFPSVHTTLSAQAGDLMRVTSLMSGSGDTNGPSGLREYDATFGMSFTIPEPATLTLLLAAAMIYPVKTIWNTR